MAPAAAQRPHVGVRVPVDEVDGTPGLEVAQRVPVGRLVAAPEHDRHGAGVEHARDGVAERALVPGEVARRHDVAQVGRVAEQPLEGRRAGVGRQAVEGAPDRRGRLGGARPAAVAAHAVVDGKAEQGDAGRRREGIARGEPAAEARIVGVGRRRGDAVRSEQGHGRGGRERLT